LEAGALLTKVEEVKAEVYTPVYSPQCEEASARLEHVNLSEVSAGRDRNWPHTCKIQLVEVSNMVDLGKILKDVSKEQYFTELFNPILRILPNYEKDKGDPVLRAWSPEPGITMMEMQSVSVAESASRIVNGLNLFGKPLQVRTVILGDPTTKKE